MYSVIQISIYMTSLTYNSCTVYLMQLKYILCRHASSDIVVQRRQSGLKSGGRGSGLKIISSFPGKFPKSFDFSGNFAKNSIFQANFRKISIFQANSQNKID